MKKIVTILSSFIFVAAHIPSAKSAEFKVEQECNLIQAEKVYLKHASVFLQMKDVNSWGISIKCPGDEAVCLSLGSPSTESLQNIQSMFPRGLELDSCKVYFEVMAPEIL